MASHSIDVKHFFCYELAPIPTSMFTDSGDMRISKTKSVLKHSKHRQSDQKSNSICSLTATLKLKSLPPTNEALMENVKHAHLQTCIYKAALDEDPPDMNLPELG